MIARRLQLWRLANFDITRLSTTGDVNVFDCVGSGEPVRRAADRGGRGPRPHAGARRGRQGDRPARGRERARRLPRRHPARRATNNDLEWNRVMLYIWPTIDLPARGGVGDRPAPHAAHRGARDRAGRGVGAAAVARRRRAGRDGDADGLRAGSRSQRPADRAARRADAAARRLHPQADPEPAARAGVPLRAGADAGRRRVVRRARPRRHRRPRAGRPAAGAEQGRRGRRHRVDADARATRRG